MSAPTAGPIGRKLTLVRRRLEQVRRMGPIAAARLIGNRAERFISAFATRSLDRVRPTATSTSRVGLHPTRLFDPPTLQPGDAAALPPESVMDRIARGEVQLLGNDWMSVRRDALPALPTSQRRWAESRRELLAGWLASDDAAAHRSRADGAGIDWSLDWRGGHRWPTDAWHREIPYGDEPGIDIKLPWELARMQHLPWLALHGHRLAADGDSEAVNRFDTVAGNHLADFITTNPPRFGVNWVCAMDVGIRIANWAIAWHLRRPNSAPSTGADGLTGGLTGGTSGGVGPGFAGDLAINHQLMASAIDHARHIIATLEWSPTLRSNHYLADIVGLLYAAAWLPPTPTSDRWLRLAARELLFEIDGQFDAQGANFEASTSYHRLSSEMAIYGVAALLAADRVRPAALRSGHDSERLHPAPLPPPLDFETSSDGTSRLRIADATIRRLAGMARFTREIMRPDGHVPQIGDNDSGRFAKIAPAWTLRNGAPFEDLLDHRHLLDAMRGLFDLPLAEDAPLESRIVRAIVGDRALPWPEELPRLDDPPRRFIAYPHFGLRSWRTTHLHLLLRCGPVGQNGNGGHAHSDQCAIDLAVDGIPFIVDPGTGVYTPDHATRNAFRAASAHATLSVEGIEPNFWYVGRAGLFHMEDRSHGCVTDESERGATASHTGFGDPFIRRLTIDDRALSVIDEIPAAVRPRASLMLPLHPQVRASNTGRTTDHADTDASTAVTLTHVPTGTSVTLQVSGADVSIEPARYSAGYGQIEPTTSVRMRPTGTTVRWGLMVNA